MGRQKYYWKVKKEKNPDFSKQQCMQFVTNNQNMKYMSNMWYEKINGDKILPSPKLFKKNLLNLIHNLTISVWCRVI